MGKLVYARSDIGIDIEDRALLHLQAVIGSKLRRGESFFFSWSEDAAVGSGRSSIWLTRSIPLLFRFAASNLGEVNRTWIAMLAESANGPRGLIYVGEPGRPSGNPHGHV